MPKIRTNLEGLVKLLTKNLYSEPDVFVRELIQNAHDACQLRKHVDSSFAGQIDLFTDVKKRTLRFQDNGLGMDQDDIREFLSTIGNTGTGTKTRELLERGDKSETLNTIGQFGIGFLSAFVVAEMIEVITHKRGMPAYRWQYEGGEEYQLNEVSNDDSNDDSDIGTSVTVFLAKEHIYHLEEERLKTTIRTYADFIPFPIRLNGQGPINAIDAPWHKVGVDHRSAEYLRQLEIYLNERYPDHPMLVIPIDFASPRTSGALYVSDQHVPGINTVGVVDIYQSRMCIRLGDAELLPEWAKFVRGVVDCADLMPTAARDNVQRDGVFYELRAALGQRVVESLLALARTDERKFHRLCGWHHFQLKGMAVHNEEFFDAVIDFLPFETSHGKMSLKDYSERQTRKPGEKLPVYYFSYGRDSNQFYELCRASNIIAINTGLIFEEDLVRKYVERHKRTHEAKQLDALHDEQIFVPLTAEERAHFAWLEQQLWQALSGMPMKVTPETRRFQPSEMSGALIEAEKSAAVEEFESLLQAPFMLDSFGDLAEETLAKLKARPLTFYINAENSLVQRLADQENLSGLDIKLLMMSLYNCAFLYSAERMTPKNAKIIYEQFHLHMQTVLDLQKQLRDVEAARRDLQREALAREGDAPECGNERSWLRFFVLMGYDDRYLPFERALRTILESPPYFAEVVLARDAVKAASLSESLDLHITDADAYVAEMSSLSANVYLELGWIRSSFRNRPTLLVKSREAPDLPADIQGLLYGEYGQPEDPDLLDQLVALIAKDERILALRNTKHDAYLSPRLLYSNFMPFLKDKGTRKALCQQYQTVQALLTASPEQLKQSLPNELAWMVKVISDVQKHLREVLSSAQPILIRE